MTVKLPINIADLLTRRRVESERIEYKAGWNPEAVLHTLCAFANDFHNLGGGYLVIGVAEQSGQPQLPPVGLLPEQIDAIQKELLNLGHSAISPPYHPLTATYEIQGKTILVLWVPGGETRPYKAKTRLGDKYTTWAYYLRKHTSTVKATGEVERELISLAATVPFDDRYRQTSTLEDLSPYLMREFLQEIGSDLAREARGMEPEALGRRMNVVGGPSEMAFPKNVGLLFFNEHPEQFFPATQIDVVYFPDGAGGDRFEEKIFKGPLGRITREALRYIDSLYIKEGVIKHADRPEAERFWNFPLAAIEEALVNAVYHRSYEIREPIEIRIERNELMVLSFPGPDRSIALADLQAGKAVSRRYRNRRIGEFLKELDLTEGRSTGLPKIFRKMAQNGSPPPIFETDEDRSYFLVHLPVHEAFNQPETLNGDVTPEVTPEVQQNTEQANPKAQSEAQSEAQSVKILHILASVEVMSAKEIANELGLSNKTGAFKRSLQSLIQDGWLAYEIPDKPNSRLQKYRLTDLGKQVLAAKDKSIG